MATGKDFGLRTIISRNNQTWVTIPKKIVDQYKIKKGEKVRFFCDSNGVITIKRIGEVIVDE